MSRTTERTQFERAIIRMISHWSTSKEGQFVEKTVFDPSGREDIVKDVERPD